MSFSRRDWLRTTSMGIASGWAIAPSAQSHALPKAPPPAGQLFSPIAFGAKGDGVAKDTPALQRAIDAASEHGGGTVHVPAGRYLCGTLVLKSNVSLWLDNGSILIMSSDNQDFLPVAKLDYDPKANNDTSDFHFALLSAEDQDNIAVFGEGIIEGNRPKRGGPKPIALKRCKHVAIRNITLRNAPNYNISLLGCSYIHIDSITIHNGFADGIDPDCSRYVRISNCFVESHDDAICLKASGALGEHAATEHVAIDNCVLRTASIHVKCGTESCGDFRNIAVSNCVFEGGMGMSHGNPGVAFYTTDEGALEGISVSNIVMRDVATPIAMIRGDRDRCGLAKGPGTLNSISISNIVATGAKLFSVIAGLPEAPINGIRLENISISIKGTVPAPTPKSLEEIPEKPKAYPQPVMFGALPAFGLFLRHVSDVVLRDIEVRTDVPQERYAVVVDDTERLRCSLWNNGEQKTLWLNNVRESSLEVGATAALPAPVCRISGASTTRLFIKTTGALNPQTHVTIEQSVPKQAVQGTQG